MAVTVYTIMTTCREDLNYLTQVLRDAGIDDAFLSRERYGKGARAEEKWFDLTSVHPLHEVISIINGFTDFHYKGPFPE